MTTNKNNDLDALLRSWAGSRAAEESDLDELAAKVASSLAEQRFLELPVEVPRRRWLAPATIGFCGGMATALLLSVWMLQPSQSVVHEMTGHPSAPASSASSLALWKPAEIAEKQRLLSAMDAEFGGHLAWLAEHGQDVSLQVAGPEQQPGGKPLAIRIVMLRRVHGDSQWSQVWSTDVVTHSEQVIDALPGATAASVWAYVLPDGLIQVDSDLNLESPLRAHVRFSGLFKGGVPSQVFSLETAEEEYRLYQTVVPLPDDTA